jgi:hypothetical protein
VKRATRSLTDGFSFLVTAGTAVIGVRAVAPAEKATLAAVVCRSGEDKRPLSKIISTTEAAR